jgi:phosphoserine phosphatase RsbU/P
MNNPYKDANILVVEDITFNQLIIADILKINGFNNLEFAATGREALQKLETFHPDVILLDIILPDMEGIEVCRKIKKDPKLSDISVIVQSALNRPEYKKNAFDNGANDFVNKPIEPFELTSRVKIQIKQRALTCHLKETNHRITSELNDANNLLTSLLPNEQTRDEIESKYKVSFASFYKSSSELGGDFYNIFPIDEDKFGFYLWDFSGHGVKAAINTIRLHTNIVDYHTQFPSPEEFLTKTNNSLARFNSKAFYATMFYAVCDLKSRILEYSYASSPSPILISFKRNEYKILDCTEFPLGIVDDYQYKLSKQDLSDWECIFLYSDALIESPNKKNKFFSVKNVAEFILGANRRFQFENAQDIIDTLIHHFDSEYGENLADDLTVMVIKF